MVLHRPQSAENIGAAARAMKNFGLTRLSIVAPESWSGAPRGGGPGTAGADVLSRARRMARKAADLLETAQVHRDLREALRNVTFACGTTSRAVQGRPQLTPRELAAEVAGRTDSGEVAIVFGEERRGLSDAELEVCQAVCTIPTAKAYDSMNLAQAVAVLSWEVAANKTSHPPPEPVEPARHETLEALWDRLKKVLLVSGFANPQNPEQILADFRRLLTRAEPSQREVELILAALRSVERWGRIASGEGR